MCFNGKSVVVTGGTGSFGQAFIKRMLSRYEPRRLTIFSRDEWKQHEMSRAFSRSEHPCLRYRLGDVRNRYRLVEVLRNTDIVVHAAAQKQVPACEHNPFEAVSTNVMGSQNVVQAAVECGVKKVVLLSTDKAVDPINLYGATKMTAEKLVVSGNIMSGQKTLCSVVRYGNVFGSRGSVIPLWLEQAKGGVITATDLNATRFWISLDRAVSLVEEALRCMLGGEVFIPRIRAATMDELRDVVAPECSINKIGMRPGEKMHETLVSRQEDGFIKMLSDEVLVILPRKYWYTEEMRSKWVGTDLPLGTSYESNMPKLHMKAPELSSMFELYRAEHCI